MIKEHLGTGRRKTAVASVRLRKGQGKIQINGRSFEKYFTDPLQRKTVVSPIETCSSLDRYDIVARLKGGGLQAQIIAMRLAVARALVSEDQERRHDLKVIGFLTRDSRKKERKKYGLKGARKRFQFSKR